MDEPTVDASTARGANAAGAAEIPPAQSLIAALPGLFLIFASDAPRYTIVAASDAYMLATRSTRDGARGIVGRGIFEAFPDPPEEPEATGEQNVRASIERAIATRAPDPMPVQLYPVPLSDGTWEEHYWSPIHTPVLDPGSGRVTHVIQRVEDVTEQVRLQASLDQITGEHADSERARVAAVETVAELNQESAALARANEMLQDQATELEIQTEALLESEAKYRSLFDSLDEGFFIAEVLYSADGRPVDYRYLEANPAFMEQSGLPNPIGRTARGLVPRLEDHWVEMAGRVAATGRAGRFELAAEGTGRWFDGFAFRVGAPRDKRIAILFTDISARRAMEREREKLMGELEVERARLADANRAKSEFLAVMSHELRTPLNAIGGYAELLEMGIRGPVTPAQLEDLRRIQSSQRHLLGLINEVLNYAKLETGTVVFDLTDVPVQEALSAAELLVMPQARSKGMTLAVHAVPPGLAVRADSEKLRQILVNLASNAVKFTEQGGRIEILCTEAGGRVQIQIRDTGMGIPPDKLKSIFDPFVQVRSDLSRPHEGTGLGLAISRDLALRMAGDLTVESSPGVGSTFTLTLPMA